MSAVLSHGLHPNVTHGLGKLLEHQPPVAGGRMGGVSLFEEFFWAAPSAREAGKCSHLAERLSPRINWGSVSKEGKNGCWVAIGLNQVR